MTLVVIDAVGLTPRALTHMPRVRRLAAAGFQARLEPVLPAVTCSVQASMLTGLQPTEHGIVGNGWYFRDLGEVFLWRQHNKLVQGEKVWETARRVKPGFKVANVCWWYAMGASTDLTVTPRPIYFADGKKEPDCYTWPPALHDRLTGALGEFPLFTYWGPTANITSSRWIVQASRKLLDEDELDMLLVYLPHLDYDHQRFGPAAAESAAAAAELDDVAGELVEHAQARGDTVVVLSEYGITDARRPLDVNRALRRAGLLEGYARRDAGLGHERAGEIVLIAEPDAWFTYYYWLDDERAPDFARNVEIHRKPGYDPAELFFDPADKLAKPKAGATLLRKKLGFRYAMQVVPLDPSCVRGSHGRLPDGPDDAPVLLCSDPALARDRIAATGVRDLLLELAGVKAGAAAS